MAYLGGKAKLGSEIARIVRSKRRNLQSILEPFCGACWVTKNLYPGPITASDISEPLILLHQAIQKGWIPPDFISEEEYFELQMASKEGEVSPLLGFVGFTSWGGKYWGGYPRGEDRNFANEAKTSLLRRHKFLKNVTFKHSNYKNLEPKGQLIYADPPYFGTTEYGDSFDSKLFWNMMRKWSQDNVVIISEYQAPPDFKSIIEWEHFSFSGLKSKKTKERLFQHESQ